jgi:hypothetical protein
MRVGLTLTCAALAAKRSFSFKSDTEHGIMNYRHSILGIHRRLRASIYGEIID